MNIRFLGTDAVTPAAGEDTACALLNGRLLLDIGWQAPLALQRYGLTASAVEWLLLTHCHQDHYLGLPQLLFWRWMKASQPLPTLHLAGPAEDLERIVERTLAFLDPGRVGASIPVELHPLAPGDRFEAGGAVIDCARTAHPVPSLCYRCQDPAGGATLAYTGDTGCAPGLSAFVAGVDLLVHECSLGPTSTAGRDNPWGHSGALDAARVAVEAGVGRLALVHGEAKHREPSVAAARAVFADTWWPAVGELVEL